MNASPDPGGGSHETSAPDATRAGTATVLGHGGQSITYQVIERHLAKFRDGAAALRDLFSDPAPGAASFAEADAPLQDVAAAAGPEAGSSLERHIERHMATVDQVLRQIRELNPDRRKKIELAPEVREQIATKERTIRDIVGAELHFWAATVEQHPLEKFDPIEQSWLRRILALADFLGVDHDHEEYLRFLTEWAAHGESGIG